MTELAHPAAPSRPARPNLAARVAIVAGGVVAGLLLTAGYALHPAWWAPWLAPVALLAPCRNERQARLAGAVAGAVAMASVWSYYLAQTGIGATLAITALRISAWMLSARLALAAHRVAPLATAVLVLPAAQAAFEALTLTVSPHGAAGSLAYSQMAHPALAQVAALGGVPAVVFLMLLPGSLAGLCLVRRPSSKEAPAAAVLVGGICLAAAVFGLARILAVDAAPRTPVAMIATDRFDGIPLNWTMVWRAYRPAVVGARGATLTVLPEKIALVDAADAPQIVRDVAAVAREAATTVVLGIEVRDRLGYRNRALAVTPAGRAVWYDKQRLVPGFEDRDRPGHGPAFLALQGSTAGIAVCKDMHVPAIGRGYASTGLTAVPAWDFDRDGWMGARMTAMRAIENGYAIVRSARGGLIGAYDPVGRAVAERATTPGVTVIRAKLAIGRRRTLYARIGDVFGWLCLLATIVAFLVLRRGGQRAV